MRREISEDDYRSHNTDVKPKVGLGATVVCGSDRYAATITSVSVSGKRFTYTMDRVKRTKDWSNQQGRNTAVFVPDVNGEQHTAFLNSDLQWREYGVKGYKPLILVGERQERIDPDF